MTSSDNSLFIKLDHAICETVTNETRGAKDSSPSCSFKLLFKARNPQELCSFHAKCDSKGPTVTILHGKYNVIYGGYTSKNWTSGSQHTVEDKHAFLFYLNDDEKAELNVFRIESRKKSGITCDTNLGPTFGVPSAVPSPFGQDYDLQTFVLADGKKESEFKDGCLHLNGKQNFNNAYRTDDKEFKKQSINGGTMEVSMVEVYQVQDNTLETPWRSIPVKVDREMNEYLLKFVPPSCLEIPYYNLLLVGVIGSGKSSFYNTLATAFAGDVKDTAPSGDFSTSITSTVNEYMIYPHDQKEPLHAKIIDIRGFEPERSYQFELEHLLNGRLPKHYEFPKTPVALKLEQLRKQEFRNEIHLVCFVIDASNLQVQDEKAYSDVQEVVRRKGIPLVTVATKLDQLCHNINLKNTADDIYKNRKALDAVKAVARFMGIQAKHVFPIVNYVNETTTSKGKDILAVQALYTMINLVEDHLRNSDLGKKNDPWIRRTVELSNEGSRQFVMTKLHSSLRKLENDIKVLCVGAVNAGKSSFIDSIQSVLTGKITCSAAGGCARETDNTSADSATEKFQLYALKYKDPTDEILQAHVVFGDMPGFQEKHGVEAHHVKSVIDGHVPNRFKIIMGIKKESKKYIPKPSWKDKIHCVCFVFDITSVDSISQKATTACKDLTGWLDKKRLPYIVVVTKCDKLSSVVEGCTMDLFETAKFKEAIDKLVKKLNYKQNIIFPVRNYVNETCLVRDMDIILLKAFKEIILLGEEYMNTITEVESSTEEDSSEEHDENDCKTKL